MASFVTAGYDVIIKPNICTDYHPPEYAATTNPTVVGTLVTMCLEAGAKRVRVMDYPFGGTAKSAYAISGIEEAVEAAGGEMHVMSHAKYTVVKIPEGRDLTSVSIYPDILEADLLINVPIAKDHGSTRLTLGAKNLMGVILNRNMMHENLDQRIADLTSLVRPPLTVIDAVRILTANGPTGGDLGMSRIGYRHRQPRYRGGGACHHPIPHWKRYRLHHRLRRHGIGYDELQHRPGRSTWDELGKLAAGKTGCPNLTFIFYIILIFAVVEKRAAPALADIFYRLDPFTAFGAMLASRQWIPTLGLALITVGATPSLAGSGAVGFARWVACWSRSPSTKPASGLNRSPHGSGW
jgi:hypothetical protein